jgi:hypothetical protein
MARYTSAYGEFISRTAEVDLLATRSRRLERKDPIGNANEINAFCRASVVLLSSHLEGYTKDLGEVALDRIFSRSVDRSKLSKRFFHSLSSPRFSEFKDTKDPETLAKQMFDFLYEDGHLWSESGPFPSAISIDRFSKGFASPSVDKISSFFGRFGFSDFRKKLGSRLAGDFLVVTNMVENIVAKRNDIAHGDPTATTTPSDLLHMLQKSRQFCVATDQVFSDWFKANFCSLR